MEDGIVEVFGVLISLTAPDKDQVHFFTINWNADAISCYGTADYVCKFASMIAKAKALSNVEVFADHDGHLDKRWEVRLIEPSNPDNCPKFAFYTFNGYWATELATWISGNDYKHTPVRALVCKNDLVRHRIERGSIVHTEPPGTNTFISDWLES